MSFNHSVTSRGLNVVSYRMQHISSVSISIIVNVGSRYESLQQSGISHFLEHMAFKGTKTRSALDIAKEFDAIGGQFNAYTSREHTLYFAKTLKQHAHYALDILADILQNSVFRQEDIAKERSVIEQEIAETNDQPDELAHEHLYQIAYENQPLGRSILGTVESIAQFKKEDFQSYIDQHYTTDNIVISVAGNVEHDELVKQIEQLFSEIKVNGHKDKIFPVAEYVGGEMNIAKTLEQTTIAMAFEAPSYANLKQYYHSQILSVIFGGGLSSRLFQKIREELGLAYSVGSWQNSFSDTGLFNIAASCEHSKKQQLLDAVYHEIQAIQRDITNEELDRAKAQIEANIRMADEKSEIRCEEIGKNFAIFRNFFPTENIIKSVHQTTTADLVNIAKQIFSSKATEIKLGG